MNQATADDPWNLRLGGFLTSHVFIQTANHHAAEAGPKPASKKQRRIGQPRSQVPGTGMQPNLLRQHQLQQQPPCSSSLWTLLQHNQCLLHLHSQHPREGVWCKMGRLLHRLLRPMLIFLKTWVHSTYMSAMIATSEAFLAFCVSEPACVPQHPWTTL